MRTSTIVNTNMVDKYCPTCGKEIKTEFRTKPDIKSNISSILGFDVWKLQGDKKTLLKLEKAIKMLTKPKTN